jgi:4-amino-4-deoxy-L-arabinose transferase-like glycosyltransferase
MTDRRSLSPVLTLTAILLLAAAFRITALSDAPPGLQHDEVFHAHDAYTVRHGYTPLWFTSNAGNEPLYIYLMAASTALIGDNVFGIRLTAVLAGLLTVLFVYRWARAAFGTDEGRGRRIALLAAALLAVSFWPVWMSRVGLRAVTLPPMVALASWLTTRALRRARVGDFALAGAALGLTLYTYPAAFAAPLVFAALYLYLAIFRRDALRRAPWGHAVFWLAAALVTLPLGVALARVEGGYLRVQQTAIPLQALREGDPGPLLDAAARTLLMWTHRGDPLWRYNVAGRPVLGPVLGAIFVLGVGASVWAVAADLRVRSARDRGSEAWPLIPLWLLIGVLPSAATDSPPAFLRASAALPATYVALALGFDALGGLIGRLDRAGRVTRLLPTLAVVIVALVGAETARAYFVTWAGNEEVQRVYRADLAGVAAYLRANDPPGGVAISTSEPHHLDRFIFDYTPHGGVDVHWFDGLYALVAPAGDDPAWLFVTREPVIGERLQRDYLDRLPTVAEERFANGSLAYTLYALPPGEAFFERFPPPTGQGVWAADALAFPPDDPAGLRCSLDYPVQFGEVVQLAGYQAETVVRPGEWLAVTLYVRVTQDVIAPEPWVIFMHLLDAGGEFAAGRDFLAVPASTWRAGDVFVQAHDLLLGDDLAPGLYHLEMGLYTQADGSRFGVMVDGERVGDRLLLEPVEVVGQ